MSEQPKDSGRARKSQEYGDCPACGGMFALMVPRKGDGSMVVMRPHGPQRDRCPGSRKEAARVYHDRVPA